MFWDKEGKQGSWQLTASNHCWENRHNIVLKRRKAKKRNAGHKIQLFFFKPGKLPVKPSVMLQQLDVQIALTYGTTRL